MNIWSLIKYDWNEGIWRRAIYFVLPLAIALFSCIGLHARVIDPATIASTGKGTVMDYWICLVQGGKDYTFDIYSFFEIPVRWLCIYIFLLIGLNNYPMNELQSNGYQILLHSKSRLRWWSSKIIWTVTFSAIYFVVSILTVAVYALANGARFSLHVSKGIMATYSRSHFVLCSSKYLLFVTLLLPFLFACFLGVLHLFFTNVIKPIHSLVVLICALVISAYRRHWLLLGNLAMPYRMKPVEKHGIPPIPSFVFLLAGTIVIGILGYVIFRKRDIFEREE